MKVKINELQDQLSKAILEQQLLKSQNIMLSKQLQRLKKRQQKNIQYTNTNYTNIKQKQQYYNQVKDNLRQKHNKNVTLLDCKILNCQQTLAKLRKLITTQTVNRNLKENNFELTNKSGTFQTIKSKDKQQNVYSFIKCEDCLTVMTPCQYFNHLENNVCPHKAQMI